jgi:hypothetical protein
MNLLRQLIKIPTRSLSAFRIDETLARIRILKSVIEKMDPDPYKNLKTFDIKVFYLVVLDSKEIQKYTVSRPVKNFYFVTINFASFHEF